METVRITASALIDKDQIARAPKALHERIRPGAGNPRGALPGTAGEKKNRIGRGCSYQGGKDDDVECDLAAGFRRAVLEDLMLTAKNFAVVVR